MSHAIQHCDIGARATGDAQGVPSLGLSHLSPGLLGHKYTRTNRTGALVLQSLYTPGNALQHRKQFSAGSFQSMCLNTGAGSSTSRELLLSHLEEPGLRLAQGLV